MLKCEPKRILVICTRRIGDVLLTTPLIHTCKQHWPNADIDVLVFKGTEAILRANPDIHAVISVEPKPNLLQHFYLIIKIFRRYHLALSVLTGDKPTLYAFLAAPYRLGMLTKDKSYWWKSFLLSETLEFDNETTHTVIMNLRLAEKLGIVALPKIILHWTQQDSQWVNQHIDTKRSLAILHLSAKFCYKEWTETGWRDLANWMQHAGYTLVLTGDNVLEEKQAAQTLLKQLKIKAINAVGCFNLSQLSFLLSCAKIYIGPDTVVSHMAAALNIPTVALFGPSNPVKWGPWPAKWNHLKNPFSLVGSQRCNNVYLIQGQGPCVPCMQEGCERHVKSYSRCLLSLSAQKVIQAVQLMQADKSVI